MRRKPASHLQALDRKLKWSGTFADFSCENEFDLPENEPAGRNCFVQMVKHIQREKATRKWPIKIA